MQNFEKIFSTIRTVPYNLFCTSFFENKGTSNLYFVFESFILMTTKVKTTCFLNYYSKVNSVIMNIHIGNLVLQLKYVTDNCHSTSTI